MRVKELSNISGVSVRTLQWYDKIGLLTPDKTDNNYREYTEADVDRLQEILFFRKLNFKLKEIQRLMKSDDYSRQEALVFQKAMLTKYIEDLTAVLGILDASIENTAFQMEGEARMKKSDQTDKGKDKLKVTQQGKDRSKPNLTNEEKFKGLNFDNNPYEAEARQKWGDKVDRSKELIHSKSDMEKAVMSDEMAAIFTGFAKLAGTDPQSAEVQALTKRFHEFLNSNIGSFYNKEVFKGLGLMYLEDGRFTETLDKYGAGTAKLMSEAMAFYSDTSL